MCCLPHEWRIIQLIPLEMQRKSSNFTPAVLHLIYELIKILLCNTRILKLRLATSCCLYAWLSSNWANILIYTVCYMYNVYIYLQHANDGRKTHKTTNSQRDRNREREREKEMFSAVGFFICSDAQPMLMLFTELFALSEKTNVYHRTGMTIFNAVKFADPPCWEQTSWKQYTHQPSPCPFSTRRPWECAWTRELINIDKKWQIESHQKVWFY